LDLALLFKFGLDGCGSFQTFNQKDESGHLPDGSTLMTNQLVALQVIQRGKSNLRVYKSI